MTQRLNTRGDETMRTPDGREFRTGGRPASLAKASAVAWRGARDAVRSVGTLVSATWRLAEALDSALWRGAKLAVRAVVHIVAATLRAAASAFAEVFRWLPSRSGRAYAAASAVVLMVSSLWAVDEIRNARAAALSLESLFRPPIDLDDPIVARVDGRYVHLSEVEASARASGQIRNEETLTVEGAFARELVSAYVEQRLLARAASEEGMQRDPVVQRRINAARDRILAASFMEDKIDAAVTPERVRRLYESQVGAARTDDEVQARHIIVATESEAHALLDELRAGGDFAMIAAVRSLDRATAPLGGEIGWFTREMMTPALADAAFSTAKGEFAEPFASEFGWHVLQVTDRRAGGGVSFAAVEDNVRRFLTLRAISQTLDALKDEEDVTYFPPEDN